MATVYEIGDIVQHQVRPFLIYRVSAIVEGKYQLSRLNLVDQVEMETEFTNVTPDIS